MAHFMLAARFKLGGTDMVSDVRALTATHSQEELDDTVFADTFHNRIGGLQDYQMSAEMNDDVTDNLLDEVMFAIWGTPAAVEWGYLQSFTETANNPEYQLTMLLLSDQVGGNVGEEAKRQIQLAISSGTVTRDVT